MGLKQLHVELSAHRAAIRRLTRATEEAAAVEGVTPQQLHLLVTVAGHPERDWASVSEIAQALQLRHHTVVGLAERCCAAGLTERLQCKDDRRIVRIGLTKRGKQILSRLTSATEAELRGLRGLRL